MKAKNIRLSTIVDVRDFVNAVAAYDGEVDLTSGRYVVDGKSIMGIFSLDLLKPIKLTVHNDNNADELFEKLERFIVE
jgi:phosphotransferase system HPr-like phosphotransfer protein